MRLPQAGHGRRRGNVPDLADSHSALTTRAETFLRSQGIVADLPSQEGHRQKTPGEHDTALRAA